MFDASFYWLFNPLAADAWNIWQKGFSPTFCVCDDAEAPSPSWYMFFIDGIVLLKSNLICFVDYQHIFNCN